MPRLIVNPATPQQWEIQLQAGLNTFGRGPDNRFVIEHPSVSTSHCQIVVEEGSVQLKDLGSTNGTFLNRAPVQEAVLQSGQRLQLGGVEMLFENEPTAPAGLRVATAPSGLATGLRVATSAQTAPPDAPPLAPPVPHAGEEPAVAPVLKFCKFHLRSPARFVCPRCRIHFCELCVATRPGGTATGKFCRTCAVECEAVSVDLAGLVPKTVSFFARLPGAFGYPFKGSGLFMLIIGSVLYAVLSFASGFSFYLQVVLVGYVFAYMQKIIHASAQNDDAPPPWPEFSDFIQDIVLPAFQFVTVTVVCFGPAIGLLLWGMFGEQPVALLIAIPAGILGAVFWPMAVLAVAMFDSVTALHPMVVVPAVFKVFLEYLVILAVFGVIYGVRVACAMVLPDLIPVPVVPQLIQSLLALYFTTVMMRLLGLMYYTKRERLGWFNR